MTAPAVPSPEWLEIAKAIGTGVGIAIPMLSTMAFFHAKRSERFDRIEGTVAKLDGDVDGLTRQLASDRRELEARFLTKPEHAAEIGELRDSIKELTRAMSSMSGQLFELARDAGRGHGPLP